MRTRWSVLWIVVSSAGCSMGDSATSPDSSTMTDGNLSDAGSPTLSISVGGSASPMVGQELELTAVVSNSSQPVSSFTWDVKAPDQSSVTYTANAAGDRITFTPTVAGTYPVDCSATLEGTGVLLTDSAAVQVEDGGKKLTYTARIIPSPTSGLPPSDVVLEVGSTSKSALGWQLNPGQEVSLQVLDGASADLPAVVRLFQPGLDPIPREIYLADGKGLVRVNGTFHALILPAGDVVAPELRPNNNASTLPTSWKVQLTQGTTITGTIRQSSGAALVGARVTIQTESNGVTVPSTVATTDASGLYSVRTRSGVAAVTVVPPEGSGLLVALVADPSLVVAGPASTWDFSFASATPVTVTGNVATSDGTQPAIGAKVVLTTTSAMGVGTLVRPKVGALAATGLYRRVLATDTKGKIVDPKDPTGTVLVPQGQYQIEVWPGQLEQAAEGYFLMVQDLVGKPLSLKLGARVTLTGHVKDQQGAPVKALVVASANMGSFSTTSSDTGEFKLYLNNQASYSLVVRSTSKAVATFIEPELKVQGSVDLPIVLPPAVRLSGKITTTGGFAISGSLIRIWCSGGDCRSHEIVDETSVNASGLFELRVPATEAK